MRAFIAAAALVAAATATAAPFTPKTSAPSVDSFLSKASGYVEISDYEDRVTCTGAATRHERVKAGECQRVGNSSRSWRATCVADMGLWANAFTYSAAGCPSAAITASTSLLCDVCLNEAGSQGAAYQGCYADPRTGRPVAGEVLCTKDCKQCEKNLTLAFPAGDCVRTKSSQFQYVLGVDMKAHPIAAASLYFTPDCTGPSEPRFWPAGQCKEGNIVRCF